MWNLIAKDNFRQPKLKINFWKLSPAPLIYTVPMKFFYNTSGDELPSVLMDITKSFAISTFRRKMFHGLRVFHFTILWTFLIFYVFNFFLILKVHMSSLCKMFKVFWTYWTFHISHSFAVPFFIILNGNSEIQKDHLHL